MIVRFIALALVLAMTPVLAQPSTAASGPTSTTPDAPDLFPKTRPYQITWPQGWRTEWHVGTSDLPETAEQGFRERAVMGDPVKGFTAIEVTCIWRKPNDGADAETVLKAWLSDRTKAYVERKMEATLGKPQPAKLGEHASMIADVTSTWMTIELTERVEVSVGKSCVYMLTYGGKTAAFGQYRAAFDRARASFRFE